MQKLPKPLKMLKTYFRYAQMLKTDGKYEESNKQMAKFAALRQMI
jgi:hypothetical protein